MAAGSLPTAAAAAPRVPGVGAATTPSQPQRGPAAAVGSGVSSYHYPHQSAQQQRGGSPQPQQPQPQVGAAGGRVPGLGMAPNQSSYAAVVAQGAAGPAGTTAACRREQPSAIGAGPLYTAGGGGGGQQEAEAQQPVNVGVADAYGGAGMNAYAGEQQQHAWGQPARQQPQQQPPPQHHEGMSHYSAGTCCWVSERRTTVCVDQTITRTTSHLTQRDIHPRLCTHTGGPAQGEVAATGVEAGIMMMQPPMSPLRPAAAAGVPYQYYYYVPSPAGREGAAGGGMDWGVVGGQGGELLHQPVYGVEGTGVVASPVMGPVGGGGAEVGFSKKKVFA